MPQRFLRPGITTSIRFNAIDWQAQTFYVRLLTLVDDFGRYEADQRILRSHVFPLGDYKGNDIPVKTIESICEQLSVNDLASFYETPKGQKVLQVSRWMERARAQQSRYPEFLEDCKQMFTERRIIPQNPASLAIVPRHTPSPTFEVPDAASAAVRERFKKWMTVRKGRGKKPLDWSDMFAEQYKWLQDFPEADRVEILSQSIRNNWQGLFPLKKGGSGGGSAPKEPVRPGYTRAANGHEYKDMSSPLWKTGSGLL